MRVSVIVPVKDCEAYIEQAVRSVFTAGHLVPDLEVVVVDDASMDRSAELARSLSLEFGGRLKTIRRTAEGRHGPGATRNAGVAASTGEYVAFLDGDDYYLPNRFSRDLDLLESRAEVDGVHGTVRIEYESEAQRTLCLSASSIGLPGDTRPEALLPALLRTEFWHANALTVRRSLLNRTGGFAEHLPMAEDCHLWLRMAAAGRLAPLPDTEPVAVYRRRAGSSHTPGWESKGCLIQAMAEVVRWSRAQRMPAPVRRTLAQGTRRYLKQSMIGALAHGRGDVVRDYAARAVRAAGWSAVAEPRLLALLLRSSVGGGRGVARQTVVRS